MKRSRHRSRGLTLVETLLLIGIFACVLIMLFPALQAAREKARSQTCRGNMQSFGSAFQNYATAFRGQIVASSGVTRNEKGKITAVDGWSWQVLLLPYLDSKDTSGGALPIAKGLYDKLDIAHGRPLAEPDGARGTPHADVLATSFSGLLCPSFGGSPYTDLDGKKAAITNYKPLGATHIESLSVASPNPLTPKYNPYSSTSANMSGSGPPHPDGVCFPGATLQFSNITGGLAYTLLFVESVEQRYARWTVGADAAVVAFPRYVEFECSGNWGYVPQGYRDAVNKRPEADSTYWTYHSYLDWDYAKCPYDAADGTSGERYGPSSHHPGVTQHLFADSSVHMFSNDVDIALYMYLIRGRCPWK
jgi:type II secretory pathway pseudopilin PulG